MAWESELGLGNRDSASLQTHCRRPVGSMKSPTRCQVVECKCIGKSFVRECRWYTADWSYGYYRRSLYIRMKYCSLELRWDLPCSDAVCS